MNAEKKQIAKGKQTAGSALGRTRSRSTVLCCCDGRVDLLAVLIAYARWRCTVPTTLTGTDSDNCKRFQSVSERKSVNGRRNAPCE